VSHFVPSGELYKPGAIRSKYAELSQNEVVFTLLGNSTATSFNSHQFSYGH